VLRVSLGLICQFRGGVFEEPFEVLFFHAFEGGKGDGAALDVLSTPS